MIIFRAQVSKPGSSKSKYSPVITSRVLEVRMISWRDVGKEKAPEGTTLRGWF
jgi:hypothetical protein